MQNRIKVPYINLPAQFQENKKIFNETLEDIASRGQFILRKEVAQFEREVAKYLGVNYAIGVNSGTDALFLSLKAMGIKEGDEVITVSHTFIATISTIVHCGATPVLVDIQDDGNIDVSKIEDAITAKTKAIVVVHMNGKVCDMDTILKISQQNNIEVLEDAAQAFGAKYQNRFAGSFGQCGAFSFHPMKVLGCMGDGGLITTQDKNIYKQLLLLRNHGQETKSDLVLYGYNSRLDNIQAAILMVRLASFEEELNKRSAVAKFYKNALNPIKEVRLPSDPLIHSRDVYSSFVIQVKDRDALFEYLLASGIEVAIHWKRPNHLQNNLNLQHFNLPITEKYSDNIISLPIHPYLSDAQLDFVVHTISAFYAE